MKRYDCKNKFSFFVRQGYCRRHTFFFHKPILYMAISPIRVLNIAGNADYTCNYRNESDAEKSFAR